MGIVGVDCVCALNDEWFIQSVVISEDSHACVERILGVTCICDKNINGSVSMCVRFYICTRTGGDGTRAVMLPCDGLTPHVLLSFALDAATHLIVIPAKLVQLIVALIRGEYT